MRVAATLAACSAAPTGVARSRTSSGSGLASPLGCPTDRAVFASLRATSTFMQLFPRSLNFLPLVLAVGAGGAGAGVTGVIWYYFSPKNLQVGYAPEQPIPY